MKVDYNHLPTNYFLSFRFSIVEKKIENQVAAQPSQASVNIISPTIIQNGRQVSIVSFDG